MNKEWQWKRNQGEQPVSGECLIDVRLRSGDELMGWRADSLDWQTTTDPGSVVSWRLHEEKKTSISVVAAHNETIDTASSLENANNSDKASLNKSMATPLCEILNPHLGLTPKKQHNHKRINDLLKAMISHNDEYKAIPDEWTLELAKLIGEAGSDDQEKAD